jgi:hypothetical protein
VDITELILTQHHEQRRAFALLDELPTTRTDSRPSGSGSTILLEVHAKAEELYFYPRLLKVGTGGGDAESAASETKDAIKDHNEIRDAIAEAAKHEVGSDGWWTAVRDADEANSDHMAEEERGGTWSTSGSTPTCRPGTTSRCSSSSTRASTRLGITPEDEDPDTYVAENS